VGSVESYSSRPKRWQHSSGSSKEGKVQLEKDNTGPLGAKHYQWVQNRVLVQQTHPPTLLILPEKQTQLLTTEVQQKRAVVTVTDTHRTGFLSRIFLVSKKDGSQRPVINLHPLNQFVVWEHFKMESVHMIENLIQEGDWMVKSDLKDTYFAVPIHHDHQKWLQFQWQGQLYQFQCLLFGLPRYLPR